MSFETYWLLVPSVGAVILWIGCLVLWLTQPRKADANKAGVWRSQTYHGVIQQQTYVSFGHDDERQHDLFRHAPS